jgi:energy-coupling factor transporter transmembrane protein EcfT
MTYEARCILASMKQTLSRKEKPTRADWLALAHAIASGEVLNPERRVCDTPAEPSEAV